MMTESRVLRATAACLLITAVGCNSGAPLAPVTGKVYLNDKPLEFGVVMFQPEQGQLAQAEIQPDGSFTLSTFKLNDGAIIGTHSVIVMCHRGHDPKVRDSTPAEQLTLGPSLIPVKYARGGTSGLTYEVPPEGLDGVEIKLVGKRG